MAIFNLPYLTLAVTGTCQSIITRVERGFADCPKVLNHPDFVLSCHAAQHLTEIPAWLADRIDSANFTMQPVMFYSTECSGVAASVDGIIYCAWHDKGNTTIEYRVVGDWDELSGGIFQPIFLPLLREVWLSQKTLLIHSSAVSLPNGIGMMFVAASGGGKTTTALSLIRRKARLLADDLILLKNTSANGVTARGVPELLNLTEETIRFFSELRRVPGSLVSRSNQLKRAVNLTSIYGPDCWLQEGPVNVIYFVSVGGTKPSIKNISMAQILDKIIGAHRFCYNQTTGPGSLGEWLAILSSVRVYELQTGNDPDRLGEWLFHAGADHV